MNPSRARVIVLDSGPLGDACRKPGHPDVEDLTLGWIRATAHGARSGNGRSGNPVLDSKTRNPVEIRHSSTITTIGPPVAPREGEDGFTAETAETAEEHAEKSESASGFVPKDPPDPLGFLGPHLGGLGGETRVSVSTVSAVRPVVPQW